MRYSVLAVIALVALVGCGGSDSDDGDSRPPAAADQFVRRVDALCKDTNPQLAAITAALTKARDARRAGRTSLPRTFEAFATLLREASATTQRFRTRLQAIETPTRERAFHDALISSIEQGVSNLRLQERAAEAQDASALRELSIKGSVINAQGKGVISGHGGFRFCGRG